MQNNIFALQIVNIKTMKKLILSLLAALIICSGCNSKQFQVTLNFENAAEDEQKVYLLKIVDNKEVVIDSALFVGEKVVLTAPNDDPQTAYYLVFEKSDKCGVFPFFTENQNTTISGHLEDYPDWTVKGCPVMDEWAAYRESLMSMEEQMKALYNEWMMAVYMQGDTIRAAEIEEAFNIQMEEYNNKSLDYIRNHPDSYLAHFILDQEKEGLDFEVVKEIASGFTTESMYSKKIKDYIETTERVQIGKPFIDFTLQTADGKDVNLAEVIKNNKVTLIDFWASWCGPCRIENPNVKAAYEKYHAKGLEIIGISVDKDEAAWLKAVEVDSLPWTHVRDIDHAVSLKYQVNYIPSNFLFDQNGVIIAKELHDEALEAALAKALE